MGASQMYDQLERAAIARRTVAHRSPVGHVRPWSTAFVVEHTGVSVRQLNYWIGKGFVRDGLQGGSGSSREFTPHDFELITALTHLAALGARDGWLARASDAMRAARVHEAGERLVLLLDGTCFRHPASEPVRATGPCWMVPLQPCPLPAGGAAASGRDASQGSDAA